MLELIKGFEREREREREKGEDGVTLSFLVERILICFDEEHFCAAQYLLI